MTVPKFLIRDKTCSKIFTRPRVLVPLVSRPRRDRDSRPSLQSGWSSLPVISKQNGHAIKNIYSLSIYYCLSQHDLIPLLISIFVSYSLKPSRPSDFYTIVNFLDNRETFVRFSSKPRLTRQEKNAAKRSRQHARNQRRSSSTEGCLPPQAVFRRRLSLTKGCPPPNVIFHGRLSSTEGSLAPKVLFHRRSSSTEDHLPPTITPLLILNLWEQSTNQIPVS